MSALKEYCKQFFRGHHEGCTCRNCKAKKKMVALITAVEDQRDSLVWDNDEQGGTLENRQERYEKELATLDASALKMAEESVR